MIVIYPKKYEKNCPSELDGVEFVKTDDKFDVAPSGMFETFILMVEHMEGVSKFNYSLCFDADKNQHVAITKIDCNFHSRNLEMLINNLKKMEENWQ